MTQLPPPGRILRSMAQKPFISVQGLAVPGTPQSRQGSPGHGDPRTWLTGHPNLTEHPAEALTSHKLCPQGSPGLCPWMELMFVSI